MRISISHYGGEMSWRENVISAAFAGRYSESFRERAARQGLLMAGFCVRALRATKSGYSLLYSRKSHFIPDRRAQKSPSVFAFLSRQLHRGAACDIAP
jgi:hypothetical protein